MVFETGTLVWEMKTVGKTGKKTGDADRFCMGAAREDSSRSRYQQKPVSVPGFIKAPMKRGGYANGARRRCVFPETTAGMLPGFMRFV
jgi:hypothetical protein